MSEALKISEISLVLSLGGYCNNNCRVCLCKKNKRTKKSAAGLLKEAEEARSGFNGYILSDGEPTLIDDLPALLRGLKKLEPRTLQAHTNARMLVYKDYADRLLDVGGVDYVVRLYSFDPAVHDSITGVPGSCVQTVKGARRISAASGIGLHIEIPVTRINYKDLPQTISLSRQLGAQGIFLSGGFPAAADFNISGDEAMELVNYPRIDEEKFASGGAFGRVTISYALEDRFVLPDIEPFRGEKSGLKVCGADTNNPFVFRKSLGESLRTCFLFMPFSGYDQSRTIVLPPMSAAGMKGFTTLLGYPSGIIDLDRRDKMREDAPVAEAAEPGGGKDGRYKILSLNDAESLLEKLLDPAELSCNSIHWICSRYENLHSFDVFTQANLAKGLGNIVKKAAPGALLAFERIAPSPEERFEGLAGFVCGNPSFAMYSVAGLLNMLEFGDRTAAAVFANILTPNVPDAELDISLLPPPDLSGLDTQNYLIPMPGILKSYMEINNIDFNADNKIGLIPYYISQGCEFECAFCGKPGLFQTMDPVRAARALAGMSRASGLKNVDLMDRAINVNEEFLEKFCDSLIEEGAPFHWKAIARPRFNNRSLIKKMRDSGCVMLNFAVESGSDPVLKILKKGFTAAQSSETLSLAAEAGIVTSINLMTGVPHERQEDLDATIAYVERNKDNIDFVLCHSGFSWQESLETDPNRLGIALRRSVGKNYLGNFFPYDEIGGRSWEEISDYKCNAFIQIEKLIIDKLAFVSHDADLAVFHIFSMGLDRAFLRGFLEYYRAVYEYSADPADVPFVERARKIFNRKFNPVV